MLFLPFGDGNLVTAVVQEQRYHIVTNDPLLTFHNQTIWRFVIFVQVRAPYGDDTVAFQFQRSVELELGFIVTHSSNHL